MRKPAFCICENKDTDQLRGNREADQRLCFHYIDSTIPLLSKSEISSLYSSLLWLYSPVCVRPGRKPRRSVFSHRGSFDHQSTQNIGFYIVHGKGKAQKLSGQCPWTQWTLTSPVILDIVHSFVPICPWVMSTESMDFLQMGHVLRVLNSAYL